MHEFRTVTATVAPVIKDNVKKGHNKWGEGTEVEESGEDGQDQEENLFALTWTTGSRQSWKQIFFLLRFCNISTFHSWYFLPTMPVTKLGMGIQSPSQRLVAHLV